MGQIDAERVQAAEEETTFVNSTIAGIISEIDSRTSGSGCYPVISRTAGLVSSISYYSDAAHTMLRYLRTFSRTAGTDGVLYITGILTIFYNENGSEDSRVSTVISRDAYDMISSCENNFSTTEQSC